MLNLAVVLAAITICTEVFSSPVQDIDLESILQYAQLREKGQDRKKGRENKYDDYKNLYVADKSQEKVELGQDDKREYREAEDLLNELVSKNKNRYNINKKEKVVFGHYYDQNKDFDKNALENEEDNEFDDNDERFKNSRFNEQALEELLSKNLQKYNKAKPHPKVAPAASLELFNERNDDDNQDEYSKVYIILNPQAIEKSDNKENLNKLLTRILSLTSSQSETGRKKKLKNGWYSGFQVKSPFARRARHDSREIYANDADDDYKPKRARAERERGGGGMAGGRTAIPYIKNRGDIYERDH